MYCGKIRVQGVVQGVGFRPFVYSTAIRLGITGSVINNGTEVEIVGKGTQFDEFCREISIGPKMAHIESVIIEPLTESDIPNTNCFEIKPSQDRSATRNGFIPVDTSICDECVDDIFNVNSRYHGYWATSCTNCGPRYSIIQDVPYDRERTSMHEFIKCEECSIEYTNPHDRRHHAQTISCNSCGPQLSLLTSNGTKVVVDDIIEKASELIDDGHILVIRGVGGFHICCIEEVAPKLKQLLGRPHQSLAVMMNKESLSEYVVQPSETDLELLTGPIHPIVILDKIDPKSHFDLSELHNLGVLLPYTGLHYLLFSKLKHKLLVMTSANSPGTPMITDTQYIIDKLGSVVEYILTHNRQIVNRCDDSVYRDGYLIRLSRGVAPTCKSIELGSRSIVGVGPELNSNASVYTGKYIVTTPHVGNVRNPQTLGYLEDTIRKFISITNTNPEIIAHDLHPQFLSTRLAKKLSTEYDAILCPIQHHCAHIASVTTDNVVGIAIDGVGYGTDGNIWGGEILTGNPVDGYDRTGHLEPVIMPGGDLATKYPERMLYGFLPDDNTYNLLKSRGWADTSLQLLYQQVSKKFNCPITTSAGRFLDAAAALIGICNERTYDGEPSMVLESIAIRGKVHPIDIKIESQNGDNILITSGILRSCRDLLNRGVPTEDIAATVQYAFATGMAKLAILSADQTGLTTAALSGGVAINKSIREIIQNTLKEADISCLSNYQYPLGDGCISYGQVVSAGMLSKNNRI